MYFFCVLVVTLLIDQSFDEECFPEKLETAKMKPFSRSVEKRIIETTIDQSLFDQFFQI